MALKEQMLEEDLTCPICVDIFREPVLLPCQHSFCRECLDMYSSKSSDVDNAGDDGTVTKQGDNVIRCPVCRSPVDLGIKGVMGLPVHRALASIADKSRTQVSAEDSTPNCSICEDDDKVTATNYCSTCDMFYCSTCLPAVHPMKGRLKNHHILSIEEFVFNQRSVNAVEETKTLGDSGQMSLCENHSQTYCLFCYTCEQLMCVQCFGEHNKHTTGDIQSAYDSYKPPFEKTSDEFKDLKEEAEKFLVEMEKMKSDIQVRRDRYKSEIQTAYDTALDALNTWHRKCLNDIDKQHDEWTSECKMVITDLNSKLTDMEILIKSSQELLSGRDVHFMMNLKDIRSRLENTSVSVKTTIKRDREISKRLDENTGKADTIPKFVFPTSGDVLCHSLKFEQKQNDCVDIRENGSTLVSVKRCRATSEFPGALTDGKFQSGKHYWEVNFTFTRKSGRWYSMYRGFNVYTTGVVHDKSPVSQCVGGDSHSWGVVMWSDRGQYKYYCHHNNESLCDDITVFPDDTALTGTVKHGFYLNCEERTFTVLDCTHSRVLYTFSNIDMSQPLTPAVTLADYDYYDVTAELVPTAMSSVKNAMLIAENKQ